MMIWSRPYIYNLLQDLSRQMSVVTKDHIYEIHRVMVYYVAAPLWRCKLKPRSKWDGKDKSFEFDIKGRSDYDYAIY